VKEYAAEGRRLDEADAMLSNGVKGRGDEADGVVDAKNAGCADEVRRWNVRGGVLAE